MYTVTRQHQWPDGDYVVEISQGGIDYANPDALTPVYAEEMTEYESADEAAENAIHIAQAWQADAPDKTILIAHGATGGNTMPFDGEPLTEETFAAMRQWAKEQDAQLPKCAKCGEPIRGNPYRLHDFPDERFDREYCAEKWLADQQRANMQQLGELTANEVRVYVRGGMVQDIDFGPEARQNVIVTVVDYDVNGPDAQGLDRDGEPCHIGEWAGE